MQSIVFLCLQSFPMQSTFFCLSAVLSNQQFHFPSLFFEQSICFLPQHFFTINNFVCLQSPQPLYFCLYSKSFLKPPTFLLACSLYPNNKPCYLPAVFSQTMSHPCSYMGMEGQYNYAAYLFSVSINLFLGLWFNFNTISTIDFFGYYLYLRVGRGGTAYLFSVSINLFLGLWFNFNTISTMYLLAIISI